MSVNTEITFDDFTLSDPIVRAVKKAGFTIPTPIQQQVIPLILQGKDVVGQAHTGTGKTAAFGLPALDFIYRNPQAQVLIVSPVRELAMQISTELHRFGHEAGIRLATIYGGQSYTRQIKLIQEGAQVIVATPGRLIDLLESARIPKFNPSLIIIDEADEMLDMGFIDDIKKIIAGFSNIEQRLLFSATMPAPIKELAKKFLNNPSFVHIEGQQRTNQDIEQHYCFIHHKEKEDALVRLLETETFDQSIVFCNTKKEVDRLSEVMMQKQLQVLSLHGDMEQSQRQKVVSILQKKRANILIATEVAARGLNFEDITHVFNYDLPFNSECYIHRIGRTGRAGKKGKAISFVTPDDMHNFERICRQAKTEPKQLIIPTISQAKEIKNEKFVEQLKNVETDDHLISLFNTLKKQMKVEDLTLRLLSLVVKEDQIDGPDEIGLDISVWKKKNSAPKKSYGRRDFSRRKPFERRGGRSRFKKSSY